jgi:hypothetical protein
MPPAAAFASCGGGSGGRRAEVAVIPAAGASTPTTRIRGRGDRVTTDAGGGGSRDGPRRNVALGETVDPVAP